MLTFTNLESNKSRNMAVTKKQYYQEMRAYYKKKNALKKKRAKKKKKELDEYKKRGKELRRKRKEENDEFKSKYQKYLKSKEWSDIRNDLFHVRGRACERCGSAKNLQIHHITYRNVFKEEPEDLEILCASCHMKEHGK